MDKLNAERLRALDELLRGVGRNGIWTANRKPEDVHPVCAKASAAILAMAEDNARLREALERCRSLVQQHNHRQNEKVEDVVYIVSRALGETQS